MARNLSSLSRKQQTAGKVKPDVDASSLTPLVQLGRGRKHYDQGVLHSEAGRWKQALHDFERAVYYAPNQKTYYYVLGVALTHAGRSEEALKVFHHELEINPDHPSTLTEIGTCLARLGRTREGLYYLDRGLQRWPQMPYAQFSYGTALLQEKQYKKAVQALTHAIALIPSYVDAYKQRALAFALDGEQERSVDDLWAAAALSKQDHETLVCLGIKVEMKKRDFNAAVLLEAAAKMAPDVPFPQSVFGLHLINHQSVDLGMTYARRSLEIDPLHTNGHVALAFGYLAQGQIDEAVTTFRYAGELSPQDAGIAGSLLFALQHKPNVTETDLYEAHKRWATLYRPEAPKDRLAFSNTPDPQRKPRIGIVSGDLRGHAVAFLTIRAFEQMAAIGYEIFCYKTDEKYKDDRMSDRFKASSKSWKDVTYLDDAQLGDLFVEQKIDVLFDLSGHTTGNRLSIFAKRGAPIQLTWAGYVGTVGLDTYEGIIADAVEVPAGHDHLYVEPIIRLPDCYVCFEPPAVAPDVGPLPVLEKGTFTFGCFNRPAKLNAEVAQAWAQILEAAPNSRILMVYGSLSEEGTRESVLKLFESNGISTDRVELLGEGDQAKLLRAYNKVDLALDPFPYSGGVTTLESIWMGVPVVTLAGHTFAGRHSASHLTAAGLASFCTYSVDDYVGLAVNWTKRIEELAALRAKLRPQMAASPLTDAPRFAANLDEALMALWRTWCAERLARLSNPAFQMTRPLCNDNVSITTSFGNADFIG